MSYAKKRARLLDAIRALLTTLSHTTPENTLLQDSIEALMELIQVKYGAIGVLDEQGALIQFVHSGMSAEQIQGMSMPTPKGTGLLGIVIEKNIVLRLDNLSEDPRSGGFPANHPHMTSLLALPIANHDSVYGRIYLCDKLNQTPFNDEDEELAVSLANAIALIVGNARKMEALQKSQIHLVHSAFHDPLTKLPNRALLCDRMVQAINHANRNQTQVAILYCDLDGFKTINDTLGHEAGDHVLKTMGERFASCVRGNDTVARVGGDEFIFVLTEVESVENTSAVANKILETISMPISFLNQDIRLFGSIGIAIYPLDGEETDSLVKNADRAMYIAKKRGKNNYQFFIE